MDQRRCVSSILGQNWAHPRRASRGPKVWKALKRSRVRLLQSNHPFLRRQYGKSPFTPSQENIRGSKLFKALKYMPKGAIHHIHLTAACPVDFLIELTYDPIVYFNERDGMFKVSKTGSPGAGLINCNEMRNFKPTVMNVWRMGLPIWLSHWKVIDT